MTDRTLADVESALERRWPESRLDPSLERIADLLHVLGDPQTAYPVIIVAGTNGKTSTSRMADAVLSELGLRVGRYTSPHMQSITERIGLHGAAIGADTFVRAYQELEPVLDLVDARHEHPLSYFETLTALAYSIFADAPVDVAVVEVGMGGRWDATNVVDARVAAVTPIGLDHQQFLGSTLTDIAGEKAGVIKEGALAVLAEQDDAAAQVLLARVAQVGAGLVREGADFGVLTRALAVGGQLVDLRGLAGDYEGILLPLHGAHQAHNAAVALAAVEGLLGGGQDRLDLGAVRAGFAAVTSPGRLEVVRRGPTVLLDAAHNPAGARVLARALVDDFAFDRLVGVVAVLSDKDAAGLLAELEPVLDEVVIAGSSSPRALEPDVLGATAVDIFGPDRVSVVPELGEALIWAIEQAEESGPLGGAGVVVTGSVVTVGQARSLLQRPEGITPVRATDAEA